MRFNYLVINYAQKHTQYVHILELEELQKFVITNYKNEKKLYVVLRTKQRLSNYLLFSNAY